jgi:CRP-like cAMP-binding protein
MTTADSHDEVTYADIADVPIFAGINRETLDVIAADASRVAFPAGETILTRGAPSSELYVIEAGQVEVFRQTGTEDFELETLDPGDILGDVDVLAGAPRTTSARAISDVTLIRLSPEKLAPDHVNSGDLSEVTARLGSLAARRIHHVTNHYIEALEREIELVRAQKFYGVFLIYLITGFAIGDVFSYVFLTRHLHLSYLLSWEYLAILCVPGITLVWVMKIPLEQCGVTKVGLRKSVIEGLIASAIVSAICVLAMIVTNETGYPRPLTMNWVKIHPGYIISSFLQEFIARGVFQNSMQRFLDDEKGFLSVLLVSILFALFHLQFGLVAAAIIFVASIIFGLFFLRHRNLAGVSLLHATVGYWGFGLGIV